MAYVNSLLSIRQLWGIIWFVALLSSTSRASTTVAPNYSLEEQLFQAVTASNEENEHVGIVAKLLADGVLPDEYRDGQGMTALGHACMRGDREIITILLKHGASAQAKDRDGDTPLHTAAGMGWAKTIVLLLQHSREPLDLGLRNRYGESPLAMAKSGGYTKAAKVLSEAATQGISAVVDKYRSEL